MQNATGEERKAKALMAVAEWRATLDAVEDLDDVGDGPTGYWGVSMGTMFGVPLLAEEPRIQCAVLGLMGAGLAGGKRYEADGQLDHDPAAVHAPVGRRTRASPEAGVELYDAFGSTEKMLIGNQGAHAAVPPFMFEINDAFFQRHLSDVTASSHHASSSASPTAFSQPIIAITPSRHRSSCASNHPAVSMPRASSPAAVRRDALFLRARQPGPVEREVPHRGPSSRARRPGRPSRAAIVRPSACAPEVAHLPVAHDEGVRRRAHLVGQ